MIGGTKLALTKAMKIVFEPELWGVSPLVPDGKTPTRWGGGGSAPKSAPASGASAPAKTSEGLKLWDGGSFDFHDILDIINPLQHLPVVNAIYRGETGDEIGAVPRILGSMLYGGGLLGALVGAATSLVNIVVEHETGKDLGQHIYTALFGEGGASRRTTEVAASKTAEAKAAEIKAAAMAGPAAGAQATVTRTETQAAAAQAANGAAPNARPITSKADAALQAFVAGLAKRASPAAAAAAANSTVAQNAVRIAGAARAAKAPGGAAQGAAAKGAAAKGDVSTQFHRAQWYQRNRAILNAQAAELAKRQAAAKAAAKTTAAAGNAAATTKAEDGVPAANGPPTMLRLFTAPGGAPAKSARTGGAATATTAPPLKPAVAGPWVANEIANGLAKYEGLVKARNAAAAAGK